MRLRRPRRDRRVWAEHSHEAELGGALRMLVGGFGVGGSEG
ncbi:hypothetical protein ACWGH5_11585 [Streptomyces sp. NPDC054864]